MRPHLTPPLAESIEPGHPPSFSVIVAAYNAAAFIGGAVASALTQTLPPLEVIVCDDGSGDDIEGALGAYGDQTTILRREHGGEGAAKNTAARAASGEFVVILDADDVFLPDRLEALGELASARPDLDILTTDAWVEAGGRAVGRAYNVGWRFEVADQRRGILERNFVFGHAAVRREALLRAGGFDESILWTTDWDCWIRMIFAGSRVGLVDQPLARYRLHPEALSSRRAAMLGGRLMTLEKARSLDLTSEERRVLERTIEARGREAELEEARQALRDGAADARRRSWAIAANPRHGAGTRAKAAATMLVPGLARRLICRRERGKWVGAGGLSIDGTEEGDAPRGGLSARA
ncbi:MAG TPA: glycosyltransferase [Solirubrobacterales bacterium]|nr:glycosyltransferase [Solirubrobacterales bacterium]